jgi:dTDP-4-dehydrorhamnose reductase
MKALVIGAGGLVGFALLNALTQRNHTAIAISRRSLHPAITALDASNFTSISELVKAEQIDWVFYPAGWAWVDGCEQDPEKAYFDNVTIPVMIAELAQQAGAGFMYFSSEYVFDGRDGPYVEEDRPNPLSIYGQTKRAAEVQLLSQGFKALVVRTTVVYGAELQRKNFVYQLLRRVGSKEAVVVPCDQISTPTYVPDLATACVECAERGITGIINITGPDRVDRFAFAQNICRVFDLDTSLLIPKLTSEIAQVAVRPLQAGLINTYAQQILLTPLRGVVDGLKAMNSKVV